MHDDTNLDAAIIEAKAITTHVPHDVPGLRILHRQPVGSTVRVCAVGDIGLSGRAAATVRQWGRNALFAEVKGVLEAADISFGNLETSLAGKITVDKMFVASPTDAAMLYESGFDLIHLANNHVCDYGQAGLAETLTAIRKAQMTPLGAGENLNFARQLIRTDVNDVRIGWLGCGRTLLPQKNVGPCYWEFEEQGLQAAIAQVRADVDVLIVSIHIGLMYMDYPRPEHKVMAEKLMVSGADLILMHHAHVLQGVQIGPQARVCCYNLGNFLFDWEEGNIKIPMLLEEQTEGAVFVFDLDRQGVAGGFAIPTWIDEHCRVHWATGERGRKILHRLQRISRDLKGNFRPIFERQRAWRNTEAILKVLIFHAQHGNWRFVVNSLCRVRLEHIKMFLRWLTGRAEIRPE